MTLTLLVLVSLAVYRGTLLVTGDRITRTPRRRLRAWLHRRAHHLMPNAEGHLWECSCGWSIRAQVDGSAGGSPAYRLLVTEPVPKGFHLPSSLVWAQDVSDYLERAYRLHAAQGTDESRLGYLLECPWCVSIYLGTIGAGVAAAWPEGWWRWPAMAMAASGVTGLLATIAAPDENDQED